MLNRLEKVDLGKTNDERDTKERGNRNDDDDDGGDDDDSPESNGERRPFP